MTRDTKAIIAKLCELQSSNNSINSEVLLQELISLTEQVLNQLQVTPQIEGLHLNPVCFEDNTSGFISLVLDEVSNTYTTRYFDSQYVEIPLKVIVPCGTNSITLGEPIEVCT